MIIKNNQIAVCSSITAIGMDRTVFFLSSFWQPPIPEADINLLLQFTSYNQLWKGFSATPSQMPERCEVTKT